MLQYSKNRYHLKKQKFSEYNKQNYKKNKERFKQKMKDRYTKKPRQLIHSNSELT